MRQELIDAIQSVKGDKRMYAAQQGALAAFPGEPCGYPVNGTLEQAQAITPQSAWSAYRSMLEHARIEVFAAGCSDFTAAEEVIKSALRDYYAAVSAYPRRSPAYSRRMFSALRSTLKCSRLSCACTSRLRR